MKIRTIGAAMIVTALGVASAHAQISPFPDEFRLTRGDLDAIDKAITPILDDPDAAPGTAAEWSNDASGSSGTLKLLGILDLGSFEACKKIQYEITMENRPQRDRYVIDYCQVEDGTWKTYP